MVKQGKRIMMSLVGLAGLYGVVMLVMNWSAQAGGSRLDLVVLVLLLIGAVNTGLDAVNDKRGTLF